MVALAFRLDAFGDRFQAQLAGQLLDDSGNAEVAFLAVLAADEGTVNL